MESYYICTSHGTFGFRLREKVTSKLGRICITPTPEYEKEWEINPPDKEHLDKAFKHFYPNHHSELISNEEGMFLFFLPDGEEPEMGEDGMPKGCPEFKLFSSKRQDFSLEELPQEPGWFGGWSCVIS
jgi:hypothetical protein